MPPNLDFATGITRFTMPVVSAVTVALWAFGVSAILTFVFAFVLGDDGRYRQYLAVNCHALLVSSFGSLATLPLRIAERDLQLNLSLGTFALFLDDGYWLSFLTLMDLFVLWTLVLVALGVSKLHTGRSWASATATVLGIWALAASGIAAIMS